MQLLSNALTEIPLVWPLTDLLHNIRTDWDFYNCVDNIYDFYADIWQWAELSGFGDIPSPRDFSAGASIGNGKVVL
jgi:hypothetical protein